MRGVHSRRQSASGYGKWQTEPAVSKLPDDAEKNKSGWKL